MQLTRKQFSTIKHLMPVERKPSKITHYQFLCALLYMMESGCKWRALPKKYGNWHTIYMRFHRWSKNGTLQKILEEMQRQNILDGCSDILYINSTCIRVRPDAAGTGTENGEPSTEHAKGD